MAEREREREVLSTLQMSKWKVREINSLTEVIKPVSGGGKILFDTKSRYRGFIFGKDGSKRLNAYNFIGCELSRIISDTLV